MQKNERADNAIVEGSVWKGILRFFFPILLGTFFQQLYNTVDAIVVGKAVGDAALAAVGGSTGTLINLLVNFFVGLSSGATVVLSQYYGARNAEGVRRTVHTAAALALIFGAFLTVVGFWISPAMLTMMNLHDDVMVHAVPYIRIYFLGMIPSLIYNVGTGLLRAVGDSRRPMLFLMAACFVNIVLDVILTLGFNMGVRGAALATVFSQVVSAALVVMTLMRASASYQLQPKKIRLHGETVKKIIRIGLPTGIQSVLFSVSNAIVQSFVNRYDTCILAGYTAYNKLDAIMWMMSNALGVAATTFMGQNFGAGRYDRMKKGVRVCFVLFILITVISGGGMLLLGRPLLGLFSDDPLAVEAGYRNMWQLVPFFITYIFVEVLNSSVRGTGDTFIPTVLMLAGICVARVVWVYAVLPLNDTLEMLLWCYPVSWTLTSLMFLMYYLFGGWLKRSERKIGRAPASA